MITKTFNTAMKHFGNLATEARLNDTTPYNLVYNYCRKTLDSNDASRVAKMVLREKGF